MVRIVADRSFLAWPFFEPRHRELADEIDQWCSDNLTGRYHDADERYELFADMGEADEGVKGVRRTKVSTTFPQVGKTMLFLFDYGDEWRFKVELIGLGRKEKAVYPRVLKRVGEAPAQYPGLEEDEER